MNKEQQCRLSKDGKLLRDIFFNKQSFVVVHKYLAVNRFVCYYPPIARKCDSVDQSTDGSKLLAPFQASQYPNGGVLRDEYGSVHFWRWKRNPYRN
jgi:hypothetical protein